MIIFPDKEYTLDDVNNEVLKRLILNSRYIWRRKGTIEGIESLLSIFGLKSNRMDKDDYDYKVNEYAVKVSSKEDGWNDRYSMNLWDWYNTTKTVTYNTEDFRQGYIILTKDYQLEVMYLIMVNIIKLLIYLMI